MAPSRSLGKQQFTLTTKVFWADDSILTYGLCNQHSLRSSSSLQVAASPAKVQEKNSEMASPKNLLQMAGVDTAADEDDGGSDSEEESEDQDGADRPNKTICLKIGLGLGCALCGLGVN